MAEGEMDSHPRVLRRLENIVAERRLASLAASSALFSSGASPKTVINCLWPRLPSAPAKKFDKFRLVDFFYPLQKQWHIITL
jgi:hypothetical protein